MVGRAEKVRPAGELRGVLGRVNTGQRQQGYDAQAVKKSPSIEGAYFYFNE